MVRFIPAPTSASPPHLEDQNTYGLAPGGEGVGEVELVGMLQSAEVAADLEKLFGCELHTDTHGGNAWVDPGSATRSICGCQFKNIRFRVFSDPGDANLRARLVLQSGETLNSLPVVDREWRRFLSALIHRSSESGVSPAPEGFLNRSIWGKLMRAPYRFARVGLARGKQMEGKCWLMLDSLFPQPNAAWLSGP
jgi:hypothetical protein